MNHLDPPESHCYLGVARGDVTPPAGIYHRTWGAATHDRATGVHRPLTATAVVFRPMIEAAGEEQVLIALDHCLLWAPEMAALLGTLAERAGVPADRVVVAFSHTHAAGLMGRERAALPGGNLIAPYLSDLGERLAALVSAARRDTAPATLSYATGRCGLAAHRDFWDEESHQFVCGFNPQGPADDAVLVARATNSDGRVVATFVNYACHPTTLAWQNTRISPDYPGAMREVVEAATGAPCVFLQGASGDLGPREGFVGDAAVADRNGRQLGYAALSALEGMPPPSSRYAYRGAVVSGATLGVWAHETIGRERLAATQQYRRRRWTVDLPYRPELRTRAETSAERARWQAEEDAAARAGDEAKARDCRAQVERATRWLTRLEALPPGPTFPLPVTAWRLGDAVWLAVECEHYQELQRALRRRFPGRPIVVTTLANGSRASYLPTQDAYGKGIYQETIAVLAAGSLERLIDDLAAGVAAL